MDKEIARLLKSSDPQDRIAGIRQLAASGHPDTMKFLGALYKRESDPTVKKLAAKAARQLKEGQTTASLSPAQPAVDPEQAKLYLERAVDKVIEFKNDEAWEWAQKAFRANPDYANDEYALGVAAEITGVDKNIALETLMSHRTVSPPEKAKRDTKVNDPNMISWGKALVGVAIYGVLSGVLAFIPMLVFGQFLLNYMVYAEPSMAADAASASSLAIGILATIVAVIMIIYTIINFLIQMVLVHLSATTILGGDGNYTNLLYHVRIPFILSTIVGIILISIASFVFFSDLPSDPAVWENAIVYEDYSAFESTISNIAYAYGLLLLYALTSIGFTIWASLKIGEVYDIGGCKGCLSIILAGIGMGIISSSCNYILTSIFSAAYN